MINIFAFVLKKIPAAGGLAQEVRASALQA
jgi:hypothetical protein